MLSSRNEYNQQRDDLGYSLYGITSRCKIGCTTRLCPRILAMPVGHSKGHLLPKHRVGETSGCGTTRTALWIMLEVKSKYSMRHGPRVRVISPWCNVSLRGTPWLFTLDCVGQLHERLPLRSPHSLFLRNPGGTSINTSLVAASAACPRTSTTGVISEALCLSWQLTSASWSTDSPRKKQCLNT